MSDEKSFQYAKRMFPLFRAIVKFCSTNRLFMNVNPCVSHSGHWAGSLRMVLYYLARFVCSLSMFLSQKFGILSNPGDVQLFAFFIAVRTSSIVISLVSWHC